jgi:hypothetical protein
VRLTRKNAEVLPFEAGGEVKLEQFSSQTDCGQFVLASHTKKRPHNLILGRFYDHRLYDLLELGVDQYKSIKSFGAAASKVQLNNKVRRVGALPLRPQLGSPACYCKATRCYSKVPKPHCSLYEDRLRVNPFLDQTRRLSAFG